MTRLLNLKETAGLLNFSEDEVMELVRQKRIPFIYFPDGERYVFPEGEVLRAITPRPEPKKKPVPEPEQKEKQEPVAARRGRPKK